MKPQPIDRHIARSDVERDAIRTSIVLEQQIAQNQALAIQVARASSDLAELTESITLERPQIAREKIHLVRAKR